VRQVSTDTHDVSEVDCPLPRVTNRKRHIFWLEFKLLFTRAMYNVVRYVMLFIYLSPVAKRDCDQCPPRCHVVFTFSLNFPRGWTEHEEVCSGGIALCILSLGSWGKWVVSFTSGSFTEYKRATGTNRQEAVWGPEPIWIQREKSPCSCLTSSPSRPACSLVTIYPASV
jgi:hypothetical protein